MGVNMNTACNLWHQPTSRWFYIERYKGPMRQLILCCSQFLCWTRRAMYYRHHSNSQHRVAVTDHMTSNFFLFNIWQGKFDQFQWNGEYGFIFQQECHAISINSQTQPVLLSQEGSVNGEAVETEPYVSVPYLMREVVAQLKAGPKVHHLQYPIISRTNLRDPLPS